MKNIADRISELMAFYALNKFALSKKLALTSGTITYIQQKKTLPSLETIQKILNAFPDINPDWLVNGMGEMLRSEPSDFSRLPIVGEISAGLPVANNDLEPLHYISLDSRILGPPQYLTCFRVSGDSMAPLIKHQDVVIITNRFDLDQVNNKIAAIQINGENTLKQIIINDSRRQLIFMPLNCAAFKPLIYDLDSPDNITILGVLILQLRKY